MSSESDQKIRIAFSALDSREDVNLGEYFVRTEAVESLLTPRTSPSLSASADRPRRISQIALPGTASASLGIGLKGVGKTATYRYFTEYELADVVLGINEDNHSVKLPKRDLNYAACRNQFQIDLVMDILRAISEDPVRMAKRISAEHLKHATKIVNGYKGILSKYLGKIGGGGVSILGFGLNLSTRDAPEVSGLRRAEIVAEPEKLLKEICDSGLSVRVVVDDPELVFSSSQQLDTHLVGGFCLAAMRLNRLSPNLKIIALLKTHVQAPIQKSIEDMSKYPDDWTYLSWTRETLEALVKSRVAWALGKSDASLRAVFDCTTEKQAEALLARMLDSVRNGPRDLLYWMSRSMAKGGKLGISEQHIEDAEREVSIRSFKELQSAYDAEYPGIAEVIKVIFKTETEFSLPKLRSHIASLLVKDRDMINLSRSEWMQRETSQTIPARLFEVGAIELRSGSERVLPYMPDYSVDRFEGANSISLCRMLVPAVTQ